MGPGDCPDPDRTHRRVVVACCRVEIGPGESDRHSHLQGGAHLHSPPDAAEAGEGTGGHSHASTMISGLYATPTYFTMTEQSREADRYLPDRFAVFYAV